MSNVMNNNNYNKAKPKIKRKPPPPPIIRSRDPIIRNRADMVVNHTLDLLEMLEEKIKGKYKISQIKDRPYIVFENQNTKIVVIDYKRAIGYAEIIRMARWHQETNRDKRNLIVCSNMVSDPARTMSNNRAYPFMSVFSLQDLKEIESIEI